MRKTISAVSHLESVEPKTQVEGNTADSSVEISAEKRINLLTYPNAVKSFSAYKNGQRKISQTVQVRSRYFISPYGFDYGLTSSAQDDTK